MPNSIFECGGCDNRWTGFNRAHCGVCHLTFNSVSAFDSHRLHGTDGLVQVDVSRSGLGTFTVWQRPGSDPRRGEAV